jgi:hypothetical protein
MSFSFSLNAGEVNSVQIDLIRMARIIEHLAAANRLPGRKISVLRVTIEVSLK